MVSSPSYSHLKLYNSYNIAVTLPDMGDYITNVINYNYDFLPHA